MMGLSGFAATGFGAGEENSGNFLAPGYITNNAPAYVPPYANAASGATPLTTPTKINGVRRIRVLVSTEVAQFSR